MNKMLGTKDSKKGKIKLSFEENLDKLSECGDGSKVVAKVISMKKIAISMQDQILKSKGASQELKSQLPVLKESITKLQGLLDTGSPKASSARPIMIKYAKLLKKVRACFPQKKK